MAIDAIRFRLLVLLIYHTRVYGGRSGNEERAQTSSEVLHA